MIGPLLRTGTLTDYHPVGAVGHPVYLAASQLRAALARRLGPDLADTFAIPQRNEDGDTLDWYAPRPGPVVPWSAASPEERTSVHGQLLETRARIDELARTMQADPDPERQVFGRLLAHVLSFPDEEHVYLVGGRPVISFWGFVRDRDAVGSDPLVDLSRLAAPPAADAVPVRRRGLPWWLWVPALLAVLLLLLFLLRGCEPVSSLLSPEGSGEIEPVALEPLPEESPPSPEESLLPDSPVDTLETLDRTAIDRHTRITTETVPAAGRVAGESADSFLVDTEAQRLLGEADGIVEGPPSTGDAVEIGAGDATADASPESSDVPLDESVEDGPIPLVGPDADVDGADAEADPVPAEADASVDQPAAEPESSAAEEVAPEAAPDAVEEIGGTPDAPDLVDPGQEVPAEVPAQDAGPDAGQAAPEPDAVPDDPSAAVDAESAEPASADPPSPSSQPTDGTGPAASPGAAATGSGSAAGTASPTLSRLSSGWRTATSLQDPKTGLPIQMEYRSQDGAGQLRLKRHDGSVCQSGAGARMEGGRLVIDSSADIRCADGTNFGRPRVECETGKDGKPSCAGSYPGGGTFSLDVQGGVSD
jgi:hypothetical protein